MERDIEKRQKAIIKNSRFFKLKWYEENYPEATAYQGGSIAHYLEEGWKKGYCPSRQFDHQYYLNTYPEVRKAEVCPLVHYESYGKKNGYFVNARTYYQNILNKNRFQFKNFLKFVASKLNIFGVEKPDYLSLVVIIKNEAPYIREWVSYYILNGVDRFYIYDNESTDNPAEVLKDYIESGKVVLINCPGKAKQMPVYNDALSRYRYKTRWLMIVDADEFFVTQDGSKISDFLKDYENYAALAVNWVMYDSNGHVKRPEGLVIENYKTVHGLPNPKNLHVKSIVNPRKVKMCVNPHYCEYKKDFYAVNENFEKVIGPVTEMQSVSKIRVNHYYCKSYEEYEAKVNRGLADSYHKYDIKKEDYLYEDAQEDLIMARHVSAVKKMKESVYIGDNK